MPAREPGSRLASMAAAAPGGQDGQMLPVIAMLLVGILGLGVLAVQIGKATVLRSDAQTAADAAALAAAREIRDQLSAQVAATGTSSLELVDDVRVQAQAARYAGLNDAVLSRDVERDGADVRVWVRTRRAQGAGAPGGSEDKHGEARARARLQLVPLFASGAGSGGSTGAGVGAPAPAGSRDPTISDDEWAQLKKQLKHHPPQCSADAQDSDLYLLGRMLQKHGFVNVANAQLGSPPTHGQHSETGWHFRCGDSGAIDLNWDCCGQAAEDAAMDPLIEPLHELGFSTIWQAPGHYDHVHIDAGHGPPIGAGGIAGGAVGPLVDAFIDLRLIDWDAPAASADYPWGGIAGDSGGIPFGPPDPQIAELACAMLDHYHVAGRARLALWEAMIVESGVHNPPDGSEDSVGVLQARAMHGSFATRMNPAWQIAKFLLDGYAINHGAIEWAQMNPQKSAGMIAQDVQGSAYPYRYDEHQQQAFELNQRFCGGKGL